MNEQQRLFLQVQSCGGFGGHVSLGMVVKIQRFFRRFVFGMVHV